MMKSVYGHVHGHGSSHAHALRLGPLRMPSHFLHSGNHLRHEAGAL